MNTVHTRPTQAEQILDALKSGRRLTALDALKEFGCMRLGARVFELKESGADIRDERVKTSTGKNVTCYFLPRDSDQSDTSDQSEPSNQSHHTEPR